MERLINRLIQGRTGTLGVIQIQAVHLHELAFQGFIQRLMQRSLIPERFMARYGGLKQRYGIALRFNLNRVDAIAPGESPDALWLSIQSRMPGFSRASTQEEQFSVQENPIAPLPDREVQVRRRITSQRSEESTLDSEIDEGSTLSTVRNWKQVPPIESTPSHSKMLSESETLRVVRRVPHYSTDGAEMPSLPPIQSPIQPGEKGAIANTRITQSPQNAISDDTSAVNSNLESLSGSPSEFILKPTVKSTMRTDFAKESASQSNQDELNLPLRSALADTDSLQHPTHVHPKLSSPSPPMEISNSLRIVSKPRRNSLVQPSRDRQGSEAIAINERLTLTKSPSNRAIAESSPEEQAPLPLVMPKLRPEKESRDLPAEKEPSTAWQNTTNAISEASSISPTAPVINPINVEKITEQVSRQILRQLRLERERRGIYS